MWFLISCIAIIMEFLFYFILVRSFLHRSLRPEKTDAAVCIITLAISKFLPLENFIIIIPILIQISFLFYIIVCYTKNAADGILLYALSSSMVLATQTSIASLVFLLHLNPVARYMDILGNVLTILFLLLLLRIKPVANLYDLTSHAAMPYRLLLLDTWLILFLFLMIFKLLPAALFTNVAFLIITILLLITANIAILYYDQRMQMQNQLLESYRKNIPVYESLISEIRASQHEYSNRLQTLGNLTVTCHDYNSICRALQKYTGDYAAPMQAYPLLQINLPLFAASLYNLMERAKKDDIHLQFDIASKHLESRAPEHELTDYACILLQNAIEACRSGDSVYIRLSSHDGTVQLEVRNPVGQLYSQQDIRKFFQKHYSTKTDHSREDRLPHGLGLYSLKNGIKKYHGTIGADCICYEEHFFMIFEIKV